MTNENGDTDGKSTAKEKSEIQGFFASLRMTAFLLAVFTVAYWR
jgi:hypothetical protein